MEGIGRGLMQDPILQLPRGTEKNHEKLSQDGRPPGRDLNPRPL
jgi:hypothetical protein